MSDLIYKGCTRPSMMFGVPLMPLALSCMPLFVVAMWGMWFKPIVGVTILGLMVPLIVTMRLISKSDDQRLMQHVLRLKMSARHRNSKFWGAKSYAPIIYKRRK
jgi:type IV secretion system protein VirB3